MSYVCVICEESLSYKDPTVKETSDSRLINVTQCGHIFHTSCLNDWFAAQRKQQSASQQYNPRTQVHNSTCPSCQRQVAPNKCLRVFPTEEHSLNEITAAPILGTKSKAELNKEISELNKKITKLEIKSKNVESGLLDSLQFMSIEKESVDLAYRQLERTLSSSGRNNGATTNTASNMVPSSRPSPTISEIAEFQPDFLQAIDISETESIIPLVETKGGLKLDDQVVWMNGDDTEVGRVLWLGKIDGSLSAGIEFVNPIGNPLRIPLINGRKAFTCHMNYGRVVPVKELILYTDFFGSDAEPVIFQQRDEPESTSRECEYRSLPAMTRPAISTRIATNPNLALLRDIN